MSEVDEGARQRLDKWRWAARFYKTLSLAAAPIAAGQVRWNPPADAHVVPGAGGSLARLLRLAAGAGGWLAGSQRTEESGHDAGEDRQQPEGR